jgi:hypothetical protein
MKKPPLQSEIIPRHWKDTGDDHPERGLFHNKCSFTFSRFETDALDAMSSSSSACSQTVFCSLLPDFPENSGLFASTRVINFST